MMHAQAAARPLLSARFGQDSVIELLVVSAVLFNPLLAVVNAHVAPLSSAHVIAAETLIVAMCLSVILARPRNADAPWFALVAAILFFNFASGAVREEIPAKSIRDVLLIILFVLLGSRYTKSPVGIFKALQVVILAALLLEALTPELFARALDVMHYYINTRGFRAESFWNSDTSLFVSATRPNERFMLPFLEIHRLSSIFLEPVSLGNYVCVATLFIVAYWSELTPVQRIWFAASTAVMLIGSDGRFALVTSAMIVAVSLFADRLPRFLPLLYLPAALLAASIFVIVADPPIQDTFSGRLAKTIALTSKMSFVDLIGGTPSDEMMKYWDSGITYFIVSQSLIGSALIWSCISLMLPTAERRGAIMAHGVCLYVACNLLVSYSVFSIKTAAPLWFLYGCALRTRRSPSAFAKGSSR